MSEKDKRPFCLFPSNTVELRVNGMFTPCCKWRGDLADGGKVHNVVNETALEFYNSPEMNRIRKHFAESDSFLVNCSECELAEKSGVRSTRQQALGLEVSPEYPSRFEVKLGNLCNLACRICDPLSSSKWVQELSSQQLIEPAEFSNCKSGKIWSTENSRDDFRKMLPHLREIYFTGGEPLIEKEHVEMLEMAIEVGAADKIRLVYNSNGTVYNEKLNEYWQRFREVEIKFSIDDFGPRYEYQRFGANWQRVQANLIAYTKLKNEHRFNFNISVWLTVSVFNVYYLDEILAEFENVIPGLEVNLSLLYLPHHYNVKVIPRALKQRIVEKFKNDPRLQSIATYLMDGDWEHQLEPAIQTIERDDRFRKQSFEITFPEIAPYFQRPTAPIPKTKKPGFLQALLRR